MTSMLRKAAISTIAALTLEVAVTTTVTPSMAQGWHGHGWHGGWGGRRGYWGGGWGGPVAAGVIGGLALGALAGSAYAYGPGYGYGPGYAYGADYYGGCYVQNRPAYDGWGNFVGYQPAQVCY